MKALQVENTPEIRSEDLPKELTDCQRTLVAYYSSNLLQWIGVTLVSALAVFEELSLLGASERIVRSFATGAFVATMVVVFFASISWYDWGSELVKAMYDSPDWVSIESKFTKWRKEPFANFLKLDPKSLLGKPEPDKSNPLGTLDVYYAYRTRESANWFQKIGWYSRWKRGAVVVLAFLVPFLISCR